MKRFAAPMLALILWGLWAFFSNAQHGLSSGLKAGLIQGTASFLITIYLKFSVVSLASRFSAEPLRFIIPPTLTVVTTGSALLLIHHGLHTPEIARTITPPIIVATLYCFYLSYQMNRVKKEVIKV